MNMILLLFAVLILAALICALRFITRRREECHNETDAAPAKPAKAKKPAVAEPAVEELPKHPLQEKAEAEIAAMTPTPAPKEISEEEIIEKIRAGLTRDQAIEVLTTQRAHDKALDKKG